MGQWARGMAQMVECLPNLYKPVFVAFPNAAENSGGGICLKSKRQEDHKFKVILVYI